MPGDQCYDPRHSTISLRNSTGPGTGDWTRPSQLSQYLSSMKCVWAGPVCVCVVPWLCAILLRPKMITILLSMSWLPADQGRREIAQNSPVTAPPVLFSYCRIVKQTVAGVRKMKIST